MKRSMSICIAGVFLTGVLLATNSGSLNAAGIQAPLGPKGETPLSEISPEVKRDFANAKHLSDADADFILGSGGASIVKITVTMAKDPNFGSLWVEYERTFRVVLRTTTNSPELVRAVENQVGRKVEVRIGGLSNQGLMALHDAAVASLVSAGKQLGRYPTSEVIPDAQLGEVRIQINSEDLIAAKPIIPPGVTVERIADLKPFPAASFAGTEYNPGCTVGYMARDFSNLKYVVTAAHCPNLPSSSYGSSHTNVYSEACSTIDTQAVRTSATTVWSGFYNYYGQWSNITAVAGGWFNNQPFDRRGRFTTAVGTVTNPTTITVSGGDCGSYPVYAFPLTNTAGSSVVGGDSGGPLMLIYNNQYYLAGQTTSVGVVSNGRSAWRSVPSGLVACTYPASQGLGC